MLVYAWAQGLSLTMCFLTDISPSDKTKKCKNKNKEYEKFVK